MFEQQRRRINQTDGQLFRGSALAPTLPFGTEHPAIQTMTQRLLLAAALGVAWLASPGAFAQPSDEALDPALRARAGAPQGFSRVIVRTTSGCVPDDLLRSLRAQRTRHLPMVDGDLVTLPDSSLGTIARDPRVVSVSADRSVRDTDNGESAVDSPAHARAARWIHENLSFDGSGVGIAMVDSGVTAWHDDLTGPARAGQRVVRFVDFIQQRQAPYDDTDGTPWPASWLGTAGLQRRMGGSRRARVSWHEGLSTSTATGKISDVIAAIDCR
jgi:subtilisin family serine protease